MNTEEVGRILANYRIGDKLEIPPGFKYRETLLAGRPQHINDAFSVKHPKMDVQRRAKIFAPFDALRGFGEAVAAKRELYEDECILEVEEAEELDRRLGILKNLTWNSRMARVNRPEVSVTYYEPCGDRNHEAYGRQGQYRKVTGICGNVDQEMSRTILVNGRRIPIDRITRIDSTSDLFERVWEEPGA